MNNKPRISRKLADAIEAMLSGQHKTQKDAAAAAGMTDTQLCRALKKPHVQDYLMSQIKQHFKGWPLAVATARMSKLVNAGSEQVAFNAADRVLKMNGLGVGGEGERAGGGAGISLQIVFKHHQGEQPKVIEAAESAVYITDQSADGN